MMVIVEVDRASSLLHAYHLHTHEALAKAFLASAALAVASDMDDAWNNCARFWGNMTARNQ